MEEYAFTFFEITWGKKQKMEKKVIAGRPDAKGTFVLFLKIWDKKEEKFQIYWILDTAVHAQEKNRNKFNPNISKNLFQQEFFSAASRIFATLGEHVRGKNTQWILQQFVEISICLFAANPNEFNPNLSKSLLQREVFFSGISHFGDIWGAFKGDKLVDIDAPTMAEFQNSPEKEENLKKWSSYSGRSGVSAEHGPRFPVDIVPELLVYVLAHPIDVVAGESDGNL